MAKFFGKIGYWMLVEKRPGVSMPEYVEREYYGDLTRNMVKHENSGGVNDNLNVANSLSIVADPFAYEHAADIRYVEMLGANWKVASVEVRYPRLLLTIGGVYNDSLRETSGTA